MTPEIIFLSRAELGLRDPRSISRNIDPSRGGVMGHWGGGPQRITTLDAAVGRWQAWQWQHMAPGGLGTQNGAVDVGYNLGFWDKYVFAGRGQGVRSGANGTNDANFRFVSAVWIGGSGETPTDQDKFTFVHIVQMLRDNGAGLEVKPHSLVRPTACPGDDWRRSWHRWMAARISVSNLSFHPLSRLSHRLLVLHDHRNPPGRRRS